MQMNRNNDKIYILQSNTNKDYNANIFKITLTEVSNANVYMYNLLQNNTKQNIFGFKNTRLILP